MSVNRNLTQDQFEEIMAAHAKARAITELVSSAITAHLGTQNGAPYSDSLWAACDSLDKIHGILVPEAAQ